MRAAIHQPMYFPYPGFFHKLAMSDVFVIMDDAQYDKRYTNRNIILDPHGPTRLTVPINKKHKFSANMLVEVNNEMPWAEYHWKKVHMCYANAKFFHLYSDYFKDLYKRQWDLLFELDFETVKKVMEWLKIRVPIIKESEIHVRGEGTQRLINVCKAIGADTYVSGRGGKNYLDERHFESNNIKLEYQAYSPVPYAQRFTQTFIPDLSIIDMIANLGPSAQTLLKQSQVTSPVADGRAQVESVV